MGGKRDAPATLLLRKRLTIHCHRRLGGAQGRSGWVRKISPLPGLNPGIIQLVVVAVDVRKKNSLKYIGRYNILCPTVSLQRKVTNVFAQLVFAASYTLSRHLMLLAFLKYPKICV